MSSGLLFLVLRHGSGGLWLRWRDGGAADQALQILHDGGEQELVAGAGQAAQPQPADPEVAFYVAEQGLDLLASASRLAVGVRLHQGAGVVTRRLIDISRNLARRRGWTTSGLKRADIAVGLA